MEASPVSPPAFPDWAHLPLDVVRLISAKVKSITDFTRFRAVCSPWRCATLPKPRHLPPQLPWLMLPWGSLNKRDDGIRLFYDLWESKTRKLDLPETIDKVCCTSYRGWLLLVGSEGKEVFLLNPLTRARIQLPPFGPPVRRLGGDWDDQSYENCWLDPNLGSFAIRKVVFSSDLTDPNCLITVFLHNSRGFLCCRVGDSSWTKIYSRLNRLSDATYHNGRFYLLYEHAIEIIDSNNPEERVLVYDLGLALGEILAMFLEGKSGVYVVVVNDEEDEEEDDEDDEEDEDPTKHDTMEEGTVKTPKKTFELYKLQEQPFKLKLVAKTRDTIVFFGNDVCPYLSVCSDDWDSVDGDSMYMVCMGWSFAGNDRYGACYSRYITKLDNRNSDNGKSVKVEGDIAMDSIYRPYAQGMWFQPNFF
ncbi:F-box family protein [Rhynchospora pubera]|uniref:F-box family protein n=1 Tax=Rhynchospora pubera TaxID=906938 RepID=A0AAV8EGP9_9POAL|nr:F-box family protein [Rhynchospora pubera]